MTTKFVTPENDQVIKLNTSGSAYLEVSFLPEELINKPFAPLWDLHPAERHKILGYDEEIDTYRYSQSYLKTPTDLSHVSHGTYMYSGLDTSKNNNELPAEFIPFYDHMTAQDKRYNQVIANWYEDENDYIAYHSDCTRSMIENGKIAIVSLYSDISSSNFRYLTIKPKKDTNSEVELLKIRLDHGSIVTMCGDTQAHFKHGICKNDNGNRKLSPKCQRLGLSFRQMI